MTLISRYNSLRRNLLVGRENSQGRHCGECHYCSQCERDGNLKDKRIDEEVEILRKICRRDC